MSYHNTSSSTPTPMRSTTSVQDQIAPPGFHYMPDGSLMADAAMEKLGILLFQELKMLCLV